MAKLFGTDGIRGIAGKYPLDRHSMFAAGAALGVWLNARHSRPEVGIPPEVVIGMDTRESGTWIAEHIAGGLASQRVNFRSAGLITTPGLAYATRTGPFAAGVMISASHNPYQDNGIKIIDHSGFKLPDEEEVTLEHDIQVFTESGASAARKELHVDEGLDRQYIEYLAGTMKTDLAGMKIVVDGANGSASFLGPDLFRKLGAQVSCLGCEPNGKNINRDCGSLHLDSLREKVLAERADAGVAFDGDADRALFVCGSGRLIDGDAVMFLNAIPLHEAGRLTEVVATVMSNLGLERALQRHGIGLIRTAVGDRYVLHEMLRRNALLGGEQSGHVIFREFATTGDGLLTALRVFEVMRQTRATLSELTSEIEHYPQLLVNVRVKHKRPLEQLDKANREIRHAEAEFGDSGRILVRFSGTEPLARVMVEGPEMKRVEHFAHAIADAIRAELG